jgi:hypothetical protein
MLHIFAALIVLAVLISPAESQACRCSVSGPPPPNMTSSDPYPVYFNDNGQTRTCRNGDQYTMPRSYPHIQHCPACVANNCACCRHSDGNWMLGYNPNVPAIRPKEYSYTGIDADTTMGLAIPFGIMGCICCMACLGAIREAAERPVWRSPIPPVPPASLCCCCNDPTPDLVVRQPRPVSTVITI